MKKLPLKLMIVLVIFGAPLIVVGQSIYIPPWLVEPSSPTEGKITAYTGPDGHVSVPSSVGQYTITALGSAIGSQTAVFGGNYLNGSFYDPVVTSVDIPSTVTEIGDSAFNQSRDLINVSIPNSVTKIGTSAFAGCVSLTSITVPNGVTYIGDDAFGGCTNLTSITIPDSVTYLGFGAFNWCYGLTSASVGNGVTALWANVFSMCTNLSSVSIGSGVTNIGVGAFSGCSSLTNFVIPSNVTLIADGAFANCASLTNISIPNSVTEIFEGAFAYCHALTNVTLGTGLTTIGEKAFSYTALTNVFVPDNVTAIGASCFLGAPVEQITMPPSLLALVGSIGLRGPLATEKLIDGLKLAGFATTNDIQQVGSQAIAQVLANPNSYNLFTLAQNETRYNEGVTTGTTLVTANPSSYNLYNSNSIMDLRMGGLMMQKVGSNATVVFQPQTTTDLGVQPFTNSGVPITNQIPMSGSKGFLRINAKQGL